MKSDAWINQYKRMIRWRDTIIKAFPIQSDEEYIYLNDYYFSFFVECNHLGDWLQKCSYDNAIRYRDANKHLDICRGIANGNKHFKITKRTESYKSSFYRTFISTKNFILAKSSTGHSGLHELGEIPEHIKPSLPLKVGDCMVVTDDRTYTMLELVEQCISSWNEFLKLEGIDYSNLLT